MPEKLTYLDPLILPTEPLKILAVDDVRENLIALKAALDQPGVQLVTAASGFEALELLLTHDFALALLDVQMPEMDGFELAELMRGNDRTRRVPIIFLTAVATDERRRFRGFETGAVDYLLKPLDITVLNSKVAVFVELAEQRREIASHRDQLASALGRLHAHGDNSPLASMVVDSSLRIVGWYRSAERTLGYLAPQMIGLSLYDVPFIADTNKEDFISGMKELLAGGDRRDMQEHRFKRANGSVREGEWYCSSLASVGSRPGTVAIEILDITERRHAEQTQRLLIGELNHRVKNTLAMVQAIASQGFRHARSEREFQDAFTGRLQALSRAHSMLSATTWESARLRDLIAQHVIMGGGNDERLILSGPDADLPPELALRFSLVFHELATNAHKYGALSNDSGTVHLGWTLASDVLSIEWIERGGPPVSPPERRGFGTTLIQHSLSADGATITSDFAITGVRWHMTLPLASKALEEPNAPAEDSFTEPVLDAPVSTTTLPTSSLPPYRILVVEDEPLVAMELVMAIEDGGAFPIGPATSCEQALNLIRDHKPNLALLDGNLNGTRIDAIADMLAQNGTPFAFISGYDRDHLPQHHAHRPMLTKPFIGIDVLDLLQNLVKEAQANLEVMELASDIPPAPPSPPIFIPATAP